ncbi:MAG: hypothetical protein U0821_13770 [Chloroflexota bacterium]
MFGFTFERPRRRSSYVWGAAGAAIAVVLVAAACQPIMRPAVAPADQRLAQPAKPVPAQAQQQSQQQAEAPAQAYTAKLQITPPRAEVGATVQIQGSGYTPGSQVELVWYSVDGRYEIEGGAEFIGQRSEPTAQVVATPVADASGAISTSLKVPLDFGGAHDVRGRVEGKELSQASLTIDPTFSMTPREGPIGTPIELRIVGVDWRTNINTWHVLFDNKFLGFMSAVTTRGVAVARFRAAGPVGEHDISAWHNSFNSIPYLNFQQGPYKDVPTARFKFRVTSEAALPAVTVEDFSATDHPWPIPAAGAGTVKLSRDRGPVGTATSLSGGSLPANKELQLRWSTMVGNRVSAIGFSEASRVLGTVTTGADGSFAHNMTIPDDLGGHHRIDVVEGETVLASTGLVIQPSVLAITPTRVRAGEEIQIHLKGVGWTTYDNTYAVTFDNSYIGYVCGFSTNGDVQFSVTATGAPGVHLIDLYPTIYKGKDAQPRVYSVPQLTYAEDHPQRITPAIRMAVEIVP